MPNYQNELNNTEHRTIHPELFKFLDTSERQLLLHSAQKIILKRNQILTKQGAQADSFFVILSGRLRVTKHAKKKKIEHVFARLNPGDIIGEMALLENIRRGFTLTAVQATELLEFKISTIKAFPEIYNKLCLYLGKRTAERLRYLSDVTVKSMEKELQESKKHRAFGTLMITVLSIIAVYMLSLQFLEKIKTQLPITTIISAPMVIIIFLIMIMVMKKSGFSWKTYGICTKNWRHAAVEAILLSLPIIIVLMAAKWMIIHWVLKNPHIPLIDPRSSMHDSSFSLSLYLISLLVYIVLAPLQELIVRGALQSGFYLFLPGTEKKRLWTAIIISNLIFSIPHLYNSPYFALLVLIPGIFWGWLFARQKTLVGVSISHIFIGVWMVFIVGFEHLINQLQSF